MSNNNTPLDGDFAALIQQQTAKVMAGLPDAHPNAALAHAGEAEPVADALAHQSIEDVLVHGEEPTEAFLEAMRAAEGLPPLTDEELAQQALAAGGEDANPDTPE